MWVVCINNGVCDGASSDIVNLTIGEKYFVSKNIDSIKDLKEYLITNDVGESFYYCSNRFLSLTEYRDKKLSILI